MCEYLGMEGDIGSISCLVADDAELVPQLHPGHGEDGAGIGAGERELVLLLVGQ